MGNPQIKADGYEQHYTEHELKEYKRCMEDIVYFAENYIKVINLDKGLVSYKPYDYQRNMLKQFDENRFNIVLACRQSGKSISSIVYILHYICFNPEKTVAVLANKGATAREMLARITLMLENLPFFIQPGCKALNTSSNIIGDAISDSNSLSLQENYFIILIVSFISENIIKKNNLENFQAFILQNLVRFMISYIIHNYAIVDILQITNLH